MAPKCAWMEIHLDSQQRSLSSFQLPWKSSEPLCMVRNICSGWCALLLSWFKGFMWFYCRWMTDNSLNESSKLRKILSTTNVISDRGCLSHDILAIRAHPKEVVYLYSGHSHPRHASNRIADPKPCITVIRNENTRHFLLTWSHSAAKKVRKIHGTK